MKKVKRHIAFFYIALMLVFKVAGLHALTHHVDDADVQHCEVCVVTTAINFTPLLEAEELQVPKAEFFNVYKKDNSLTNVVIFKNRHLSSYHFTRPPPFVS